TRLTSHVPRCSPCGSRRTRHVQRVTCNMSPHDPRPPRPRSPAGALALDGSLRPPAVRLAGERRPRIRGATRGPYWRTDPRNEGRTGGGGAPGGRLSPLVGSGGGPDGARTARTVAGAGGLRGARFVL